jgi:hypothetical protein
VRMASMTKSLGIAAIAFAAIPALAQEPAPTTAAHPAGAARVIVTGDRLICRRVSRTGTRLSLGTRCLSRDEWMRARGSAPTREYSSLDAAAQALAVLGNASTTGCGLTPP